MEEQSLAPAAEPWKKSLLREYVEAIVIALVLALVIRAFVVQAFKIPSESMVPTLLVGDHILVNKFVYRFIDPKRGDIIVFKFPQDERRDFIKRVIGLPGEKLEVRDRQIYINNEPLSETYAFHDSNPEFQGIRFYPPRDEYGPVVVPKDCYFVMGDNRENSQDSRYWGFLKEEKIRGRAFIIYWSWDKNAWGNGGWGIRWNRFGKILK